LPSQLIFNSEVSDVINPDSIIITYGEGNRFGRNYTIVQIGRNVGFRILYRYKMIGAKALPYKYKYKCYVGCHKEELQLHKTSSYAMIFDGVFYPFLWFV
jgi:hypothetical protein